MAGVNEPGVLALITAGLAEVKEAVTQLSRDLHGTLAKLPNDYVPRRELERRLDELTLGLGEERITRERALAELSEVAAQAEKERTSHRRWLIGLATATAMSGMGVIAGLVTHFS